MGDEDVLASSMTDFGMSVLGYVFRGCYAALLCFVLPDVLHAILGEGLPSSSAVRLQEDFLWQH